MTYEEITNMQSAANIKFDVSKEIVKLLAEAEAKFDQIQHDLDWQEELEQIQAMVFED